MEIKSGKGEFVLYHGSLEVGENNEAALFLVNQVFSNLKIPFVIAGNKPSKELKEAVAKHKHITLNSDSPTDEIYQLIADAQINILPTFQSTGIKLKLLAALYSGRHCIVNSFMVENTGLEALCTVANTSQEMQETVKKLFKETFSEAEMENRKRILLSGFGNRENILKLIKVIYLPQPAVAG
ncbi:MAG: glycosyltransferase [Bacteroidia bacterium]